MVFVIGAAVTAAIFQVQATAQVSDNAGIKPSQSSLSPPPFQNNLAPISAPLRFFVQEKQRRLAMNQAAAQSTDAINSNSLLMASSGSLQSLQGVSPPASAAAVASPCDSSAGALFNLEPAIGSPHIGFVVPQNSESVDFIPEGGILGSDLVVESAVDYRGIFDYLFTPFNGPNLPNSWGLSASGYYVHRMGSDCSVAFEGGFPHVKINNGHQGGPETIYGSGEPTVAANPTNNRVYAADLRIGVTMTGIGLVSTTAARLNDPAFCPNGTHLTDMHGNDSVSSQCWPIVALLGPQAQTQALTAFPDKPYVRADERPSGVGAGDVYVSWTVFNPNGPNGLPSDSGGISYIQLAVCPYNFKTDDECSPAETISGNDANTQFSQISVRPDGIITITYVDLRSSLSGFEVFDIKYVSCQPGGAPRAPACSAPSLVFSESQPLPSSILLFPTDLPYWTYPVHDGRANGKGYEEFVAWARCSVDPFFSPDPVGFGGCPDADILMTWSTTDSFGNPQGWATPVGVNTNPGNQVMPSLRTDRGTNTINIGYLSAEQDPYQRRYQVFQAQILPGAYDVNAQQPVVAAFPDEPAADPFYFTFLAAGGGEPLSTGTLGGYIGVAARSTSTQSHVYFGFTGQIYQGLFGGQMVSGSNNLLSRVDY